MGTGKFFGNPVKMVGVTCDGQASHPGGVEILVVTSCYGNWDKLWQLWATELVWTSTLPATFTEHYMYTNLVFGEKVCGEGVDFCSRNFRTRGVNYVFPVIK